MKLKIDVQNVHFRFTILSIIIWQVAANYSGLNTKLTNYYSINHSKLNLSVKDEQRFSPVISRQLA